MMLFPGTRSHPYVVGLVLVLLLIALGSLAISQGAIAQNDQGTEPLPPGAKVETVLTGMNNPIAMVFDPSGRLFYTEKTTGSVRLFANGVLQPDPVITFKVNSDGERGLLGITLDPSFTSNHLVYVYYSCGPGEGCPDEQNRVVRFVESNGKGSNPQVIFTSPDSTTSTNHNGGNIHFGPDGKLYISIGDDANAANAQDLTVKNGKMHRIDPDGTMATDNPRFADPNALPSIFAYGLRNTFDFAFDPFVPVTHPRIWGSENGPSCDDEMNRIEGGNNYGWRADYPCDDANPDLKYNTISPLWFIPEGKCCEAPTGIEVYTGTQVPQWKNDVFMATYTPGKLYHFYLNGSRTDVTSVKVVEGITANMDVQTGPDGALYYMEGGGYTTGTLRRIVGTVPKATPTPLPAGTIPGSGSRTFPETGKTVTGIFLDYWNNNGGLMQQGYPISDIMEEVSDLNGKPYAVQYFERAVFEYHPENHAPYNVLLSQLGTFQYRKEYLSGAPNQRPNNSPGSVLFPETGKRVGGRFLAYWQANGGLMQQGYPISDEFEEKSALNEQVYTVQYFERAVFEYHPENKAPYDVLLSQLGAFRYKAKYPNGGK